MTHENTDEAMQHCACPRDAEGWSKNWRFCERHQSFWCIVCDGRCDPCESAMIDEEPQWDR